MSFCMTQKVLFKHCDPAGIVFYPRYFEMINDAVEAFFDEVVGDPFETMHATHGVPTVKIEASFDAVSRHGDMLDIAVTPTRVGRASLDLSIRATCNAATRFAANATLVRVRKDMSTDPWTTPMRDAFASTMPPQLKDIANG